VYRRLVFRTNRFFVLRDDFCPKAERSVMVPGKSERESELGWIDSRE
jgi:hypothetical protein